MKVIKRDNSIEIFDFNKIKTAVEKGFKSCGYENPSFEVQSVMDCITGHYDETSDVTVKVEDIQDNVEKCLMSNYPDVAKHYIIYRYNHKLIRENKDKLIKGLTEKLMAVNVQNQNANMDENSFGGRIGEASHLVTKQYALDYCMSRKSRKNHLENEIYIHDLDSYVLGSHNCITLPYDDLLKNGFQTRQTDVRPAQSVHTAINLLAVMFQLQSLQQFGGVAVSHLDWSLVPMVRKSFLKHYKNGLKYISNIVECNIADTTSIEDDVYKENEAAYNYAMDLTKKELAQAVEEMYHNLVTLQSRSGNQLPFSSINYGTCTLPEGRMVIKALLEGSIKGVGKHHITPIFPCGIFQLMKGVNRQEGEPNYDLYKLALKSTSLRLYPNYANCDWSGNAGYDKNDPKTYFATMGCHAKDTPIIMADGTKKMVQDIVEGDKIMGIKGQIRTVQSLIRGNDRLFKINQSNAESYVVNEEHILSLIYTLPTAPKNCIKNCVVNMTVKAFMKLPLEERAILKGYKYSYLIDNLEENISTITVEEVERGDFYGFELDGDRLYVINDGTVTHNCRTANGWDINGLGQQKDGRGNICPVTIILPTLAKEAVDKVNAKLKDPVIEDYKDIYVNEFIKILDKKIGEAKDMLIERFNYIASQSPLSAKFMWDNNIMAGYNKEEGIISALRHGTLAIGQLGLSECLYLLIGQNHTTEEGMAVAKKIESLFSKRCKQYKEKYQLNFGVYYTPAESLCHTALKKFREKYGVIENVSDRDYFTNSIHVPVWMNMNPFEKIDIESQLTGYSSAGCITYIELPSTTKHNIEALETIVNYAMDKDIPYFAVNMPNDTCHDCGYCDEINDKCPQCGSTNIKRLRRVTGYLTGDYMSAFNNGKIAETNDRVKHINN